jgi:DNA polymerase V
MVFVNTNRFQLDQPQYRNSVVVPLLCPTDDSRVIVQAATHGLQAIFAKGYRYQKAGVMLLDLTADANRQLSLDDTPQTEAHRQRSQRLMATVDKLNRELGRDTVRLGLPRQGNAWALHVIGGRLTRRGGRSW